jgi:hypothetical protein
MANYVYHHVFLINTGNVTILDEQGYNSCCMSSCRVGKDLTDTCPVVIVSSSRIVYSCVASSSPPGCFVRIHPIWKGYNVISLLDSTKLYETQRKRTYLYRNATDCCGFGPIGTDWVDMWCLYPSVLLEIVRNRHEMWRNRTECCVISRIK